MRSRIINVFKYALGISILAWLIGTNWHADPGSSSPGLSDLIRQPVHLGPLFLAIALCAASVLVTFLRWHLLVLAQGLPFTRRNAVRLGLVGYYFNVFLPGAVGGDLLKAWAISREQTRRTVAVATVLADRVIGMWGLFWMVALIGAALTLLGHPALVGNEYLRWIVRVSWWVVGSTLGFWLAMGLLPRGLADHLDERLRKIPKLGGPLAELWSAVWLYRRGANRAVFVALGLSLISHGGFVLTYHCAAQVFTVGASGVGTVAEHYLIYPVGALAQAFFPTPGGVGGAEAAFAWLYSDVLAKSATAGIAGMLTFRAVTWLLGFSGYLVYLRMATPRETLRKSAEVEPAEPPITDSAALRLSHVPTSRSDR